MRRSWHDLIRAADFGPSRRRAVAARPAPSPASSREERAIHRPRGSQRCLIMLNAGSSGRGNEPAMSATQHRLPLSDRVARPSNCRASETYERDRFS